MVGGVPRRCLVEHSSKMVGGMPRRCLVQHSAAAWMLIRLLENHHCPLLVLELLYRLHVIVLLYRRGAFVRGAFVLLDVAHSYAPQPCDAHLLQRQAAEQGPQTVEQAMGLRRRDRQASAPCASSVDRVRRSQFGRARSDFEVADPDIEGGTAQRLGSGAVRHCQ